jgi:hypothetical protein
VTKLLTASKLQIPGQILGGLLSPLSALIVLLVVCGVPIWYSSLAALIIMSHTIFGMLLYIHYSPDTEPQKIIGIGFALGTFCAVCIDQLLVSTPLRDHSWILMPTLATVYLLRTRQDSRKYFGPKFTVGNFFILIFLSFLGLVQERYWPLWIAVSMIPLLVVTQTSFQKFRFIAIISCTSLVGLTTFRIVQGRPSLWWIKTQDFQFFESLSYSLAHWGFRDQVYATGNPILYHWFSFAWTGMLSRVINAPDWLVLTKIGPPVIILFLVLILNDLLTHFQLHKKSRIVAISVIFLLNDLNFESFSMVFSYIFLIAFALATLKFFETNQNSFSLFAALLASAALATKSSNIAVLGGGLLGVAYFGWRKNKVDWTKICIFTFMVGAGLSIVFLMMYFRSPYGGNIEFGLIGIAQDSYGDIAALPKLEFVFWSFVFLIDLAIFFIFVITCYSRILKLQNNVFFWLTLGSTPISLIALLIARSVHEQEEYFQHSWVMYASICLVILLNTLFSNVFSQKKLKQIGLLTFILLLATWLVQFLIPTDNSGTYHAIKMRILDGAQSILLFIVALIVLVAAKTVKGKPNLFVFTTSILAAGTIMLTFTLNSRWIYDQNQFKNEISSSGHSEYMFGSSDVQEMGHAINQMTPENAIIASNYFCSETICATKTYSAHRADWAQGGEAMYLALYSHRRYLVSGYGFLWQNVRPTDEVVEKIDLSIMFGERPTSDLLNELLKQGVSYFVLDKTMTPIVDWSNFGRVLVSNRRFMLIQLTTTQ